MKASLGNLQSPALPRRALRVEEAQRALGIGKTKIYELIKDGRLETVRIDRSRLIPVEAIEALLASAKDER